MNDFEQAQEHLEAARKAVQVAEGLADYGELDQMALVANLHVAIVTATSQLLSASAQMMQATTTAAMNETMRQAALSQKEGMAAVADVMDRQVRGESGPDFP